MHAGSHTGILYTDQENAALPRSSQVDQQRRANNRSAIVNTSTLSQQVYDHLRERILANDYPPGTPLPEVALAERFSVSRVPVREALRRLDSEGLVTLTPRQGATVSSLSPKQFLDAYRVREALESLAIRLATPLLRETDLALLESLHEEMGRSAANGNTDAFFDANSRFHDLFILRSDNADLQAIYDTLMVRMQRYRSPSLDLRGGMERSIDEHGAILVAVRSRDGETASRLLAAHIHVPQEVLEREARVELSTRN